MYQKIFIIGFGAIGMKTFKLLNNNYKIEFIICDPDIVEIENLQNLGIATNSNNINNSDNLNNLNISSNSNSNNLNISSNSNSNNKIKDNTNFNKKYKHGFKVDLIKNYKNVTAIPLKVQKISYKRLCKIFEVCDLILCCVDNVSTRQYVNHFFVQQVIQKHNQKNYSHINTNINTNINQEISSTLKENTNSDSNGNSEDINFLDKVLVDVGIENYMFHIKEVSRYTSCLYCVKDLYIEDNLYNKNKNKNNSCREAEINYRDKSEFIKSLNKNKNLTSSDLNRLKEKIKDNFEMSVFEMKGHIDNIIPNTYFSTAICAGYTVLFIDKLYHKFKYKNKNVNNDNEQNLIEEKDEYDYFFCNLNGKYNIKDIKDRDITKLNQNYKSIGKNKIVKNFLKLKKNSKCIVCGKK